MGDISDAMQNLVDDIKSSTESRRVKISEMKADVRNMLERFHFEREGMAKDLEEKFSSDNAARGEAVQRLREAAQRLRSDVRSFMNQTRSDVQNMAKALEEKLASDDAARVQATQQLMNEVRSFMSDLRSDLQDMAEALKDRLSSDEAVRRESTGQFMHQLISDRRKSQEIWRSLSEGISEPVLPPAVVEEADSTSEDKVLEIIAKHAEGIKLVDIGNELGVDWRGLIATVKPLVDEGRVEKIDNLYYPKS